MITLERQTQSVVQVMKTCQQGKFWGSITLEVRDGNTTEIRLVQTIRPDKILLGEDIPCLPNVQRSS